MENGNWRSLVSLPVCADVNDSVSLWNKTPNRCTWHLYTYINWKNEEALFIWPSFNYSWLRNPLAGHGSQALAWKPGSWVRVPLKAWIFSVRMRLFCVCVVLRLGRGLATSWSPVQGALLSVKWSRNWEISHMLQIGSKEGGKKLNRLQPCWLQRM
jgi:hypothetical protein